MTVSRRHISSAAAVAAVAAGLLVALFAPSACAAEDAGEKVRAYVGGEPVTTKELDELARGAMADFEPEERLRYAIKRRALVQRALKEGVYREQSYRDALRTFREDALVRALLEKKSRELAGSVTVTDKELAVFAERMCYTVTFMEREFGELRLAERFMARGILGHPQEWDGEVTVAGCENIGPLMADAVYSMEQGEEKVVARGRRFTVVKLVEKKKTVDASSLPDRRRIREYLMEKKTAKALDEWVDSVVGETRVRYVGGAEVK